MTKYQIKCPKCGKEDEIMVEGRVISPGRCDCGAKREVVASEYVQEKMEGPK